MTHRLATNYAKNYCNRTLIVKLIVENIVTCFFGGHGVLQLQLLAIFQLQLQLQLTDAYFPVITGFQLQLLLTGITLLAGLNIRVPGCKKIQMTA